MQSKAKTVAAYLAELPADRREAISAVRKVILKNLDKEFEEGMTYGMIGYYVPHSIYPAGYHCDPKQPLPFANLASQKNHLALYVMSIYGSGAEETWLRQAWAQTGKKLDMGKGCIRFKTVDDLPLDVIGELIRRTSARKYIDYYEATFRKPTKSRTAKSPKKSADTAPTAKKKTAKATKKTAASKKRAT